CGGWDRAKDSPGGRSYLPNYPHPPAANATAPLSRLRERAGVRVRRFVLLPAAEQLFDIGELELYVGRPAMIALAGMGRRLHLAEQRVHLLARQPPPGTHAAVAGERAAYRLQPLAQANSLAELGKVVGDVTDQRLYVRLAEQRRHFAHHYRPGTEWLHRKTELGELLRPRQKPGPCVLLQLDHLGDQ